MPSWQARATSLAIRALIKRRPPGDLMAAVRMLRSKLEPPAFLSPPLPAGARIVKVDHGSVRGEWIEFPDSSSGRTIYYLHGGGYIACSPATHRGFTTALSKAARARVFALDYRLAPEHPFPAAVEDAVSGYRWLLDQGIAPGDLIIGGDSAGGGLTMAALIWLRDSVDPLPRSSFVLSPWSDLAVTGDSIDANEKTDSMFYSETIRKAAPVYLGGASPQDPLASPLYADLKGLPPLLIYVSDSEVLLDDSLRLAQRAEDCGVDVELRMWKDLPHVWPIFVRFGLPEAKKAIKEIAEFIDKK